MEKGLESFKAAVFKDCEDGDNCFSENGCTKERFEYKPQDNLRLYEMGFTTQCVHTSKCFHDYCGKYKWVLDRAKHYAEKTGKTVEEVMKTWETRRTYWYMNFYQDSKQPMLTSDKILNYEDWISGLKDRFGVDPKKWAFKCPSCGNAQTAQHFIDNGVGEHAEEVYYNCIGRYVKGKGCNWTLGGLLDISKVSVLKDAEVFPVFEMADNLNR